MQFDNSYFRDEIREGFYIPGMIKRSWAMQLETLQTIAELCEKHGIRWFADYGTLLGTARHRGFIPWDDDLDICMLRDDYDKFNEVVQGELPEGYQVVNFDTFAGWDKFLTRILSSNTISIENQYLLRHHGFPYIAGIDVFPLDYLYPDEEREKARMETANTLYNLLINVIAGKERRSKEELGKYVSEVSGYSLDTSLPAEAGLYRVLAKIFSECRDETSEKVTLMSVYIEVNNYVWPAEWYEKTIMLPFETGYIKVPAAYGQILNAKYGAWYAINKHGGSHEYPFYANHERAFLKKNGTAPYIYKYHAADQAFQDARRAHALSTDEKKRLLVSLEALHEQILTLVKKKKYSEAMELLERCQETAITAGTAIEQEQGEGCPVIKYLEDYCEHVYAIYENLSAGSAVNVYQEKQWFEKLYAAIKNSYDNDISRHQEVLFIPVYAKDWDYMAPLYERYASEENTDVYVMPAVFAERADDGNMLMQQDDYNSFQDSLPLVRPKDYDLDRHHPDVIIIQNPYDQYQSGFTVHPFFYAANLYKCTEKLVYCQSFIVDDIEEDDEKALTNAVNYIMIPGVVLSDEIYVPNENMKSVYIKLLSHLPGKKRGEWDNKIKILPASVEKEKAPNGDKPFLIFHVTDGDYITCEKVFEKIRHSMGLFAQEKEKLDIIWAEDAITADNIRLQSQELYEEYEAVKKEFIDSEAGNIISVNDAVKLTSDAAGYYGSAGYLMNMCVRAGVPVMVWMVS